MIKKTTTKLVAAAFALAGLFFAGNAQAQSTGHDSQNTWRFGIGVEPAITTGNVRDISNFAVGGTARLQYDIKGSVSLMLTSGYYNFFGKTQEGDNNDAEHLGMVPLKAGVKAFFVPHAYISGEVGAGFETNYYKDTKLILSPGIGYASSGSGVDVSVRYENFSGQSNNYGMVALRVAYGFRL